MIFFLIVLLGAGVVAGFYVHQNPGGTDVSLFGWQWSGVSDWAPVLIAAGGIALIAVLTLTYQRWRIAALRRSVLQLRSETLALRQGAAVADAPVGEGHVVGRRPMFGRWLGRRRHASTPPPEAAVHS